MGEGRVHGLPLVSSKIGMLIILWFCQVQSPKETPRWLTLSDNPGYPLWQSWLPSLTILATLSDNPGYPLWQSWLPSLTILATLSDNPGYPLWQSWLPSLTILATLSDNPGYPLWQATLSDNPGYPLWQSWLPSLTILATLLTLVTICLLSIDAKSISLSKQNKL